MIKGVIFDLDNTLYDYDSCDRMAQERLQMFCEQTLHITKEEFVSKYAEAKTLVKQQLGDVGASHNRMLYMQRLLELTGNKPVSCALEMYDIYWNTMLENMKVYPYVESLFQILKEKGIKIGILTDLTAHIQHRKLRALAISDYVDVIVSSEEAGAEKPDKCMFDLVKKKMDMEPEQLLMIGDSYEKDCAGAEEAGMRTIHFKEANMDNIVKEIHNMCFGCGCSRE